jgi:hypothetical protein
MKPGRCTRARRRNRERRRQEVGSDGSSDGFKRLPTTMLTTRNADDLGNKSRGNVYDCDVTGNEARTGAQVDYPERAKGGQRRRQGNHV